MYDGTGCPEKSEGFKIKYLIKITSINEEKNNWTNFSIKSFIKFSLKFQISSAYIFSLYKRLLVQNLVIY